MRQWEPPEGLKAGLANSDGCGPAQPKFLLFQRLPRTLRPSELMISMAQGRKGVEWKCCARRPRSPQPSRKACRSRTQCGGFDSTHCRQMLRRCRAIGHGIAELSSDCRTRACRTSAANDFCFGRGTTTGRSPRGIRERDDGRVTSASRQQRL